MASYRLSDELPDSHRPKPPWSPLGLFFLTWLFLPVAVPFWLINWGRLGHGEKRLVCALAGAAAVAVPWVLHAFQLDKSTVRFLATLAKFGFAYFQLLGQRPLYEAHLNRGGAKAPAWPLWSAAVAGIALPVAFFLLND